MKTLLRILFPLRKQVVELPELCGPRLALSELVAALHGAQNDPRVRALLQVLAMRRQACDMAAADSSWKGQDNHFHMGGRQAIDDAFADLSTLLKSGTPDDEIKAFFPET